MTNATKVGISVLCLLAISSTCLAALNKHHGREYISYEAEASSPQEYEALQPAARLSSYRKSQPQQAEEYKPVSAALSQKFISIGDEYERPAPTAGGVRKPLASAFVEEQRYSAPAPPARKHVEERVYHAAPVRKPAAPVPADYTYSAPAAAAPAPVRKPVAEEHNYSAPAPAAPARKQLLSGDSYSYTAPASAAAAPARKHHGSSSASREESERLTLEQNSNAHYQFASAVNDGIQDQSQVRKETRDGLKVSGEYSYSDGFVRRTVKYEADENGYRVVGEESEPIGAGPQVDLVNGKADVHTQVQGVDTVYSISAHDFVEKDLPAESGPQQVAKPKSHIRHKQVSAESDE